MIRFQLVLDAGHFDKIVRYRRDLKTVRDAVLQLIDWHTDEVIARLFTSDFLVIRLTIPADDVRVQNIAAIVGRLPRDEISVGFGVDEKVFRWADLGEG